MIAAMSLTLCGGALVSALFFGSPKVLTLLLALAAGANGAAQLLLFRGRRWKALITGPVLGGLLVLCLLLPTASTGYGTLAHREQLAAYQAALEAGDEAAALERAEALADQYGADDYSRYLRAMDALTRGDPDEAGREAERFDDRRSVLYYQIMEDVLRATYDESQGLSWRLRQLFAEASDSNPGWVYAARNAGILALADERWETARYYLARAYANAEAPDGALCYYLGAAIYQSGDLEKAFGLFEQAVELGVDEELQGWIVWYCDQVTEEGTP